MASIVERTRKDGTVGYQIRWLESGRQQATTAATHKDARRIKAIVEATGTFTEEMGRPDVPTVREVAAAYLEHGTRANDDSREDYRRTLETHVFPQLGDVAVTALAVPMLTAWANGLVRHDRGHEGERLSDKSRANVTSLLSSILEHAVPEHLPSNPFRRVRIKKTDGPKDQHFLRAQDFGIVLAEIPEHYRLLITTLATSGLRWGEVAALTVADVDLRPLRLRVTKAVKHRAKQGAEAGVPKTKKAVRLVSLPAELGPSFAASTADRPPSDPLFPTVRGKRLRNSTFHTLVWQPALDRAVEKGLPFRPRIHDLRAAAVTWLLDSGLNPYEVADMMGHESIKTTLEIYRRANPVAGAKAAEAMSRTLGAVLRPELEP